ncbi:MAG: DUF2298 domain-containing protein [Pseudomonadota bacterium]
MAAKIMGWLVIGYVPWFFASIPPISFQASAPVVGIVALALSYAWLRPRAEAANWRRIAVTEAVFLALFWLGLATRLGIPDVSGLEKFMDLGFMAAAMGSDAMPPADPWFSGLQINYYYFGHAQTAAWALLADLPADHAYQLAMATLFALTGLGVIQILRQVLRQTGRAMANIMAGLGAALVLYAGNLHSFLYDVLRPWMSSTKPGFYMPDSTRFIGFDPPTDDKGFTEFPAYAFAVGDMHGHVLATPMVLLAILVIKAMFLQVRQHGAVSFISAAAFGWLLALCYMTNSWDTAIIGLVALVVLGVTLINRALPVSWDQLSAAMLLSAVIAVFVAAPFQASFEAFHDGPRWATGRQTPFWQILVVYGHVLPGALAAVALAFLWRRPGMVFAAGVSLAALLLIVIPEIIYIKDIYGSDHARANTMFKLSFRAQTFLQIGAVVAIGFLAASTWRGMAAALILLLPLVGTFSYASHIFRPPAVVKSLDGMAFLGEERTLVAAAMTLPMPRDGGAMLEAPGHAYTDAARVSAMSGRPTVLGWIGHQTLWRGNEDAVQYRLTTVDKFYGSDDLDFQCRVIRQFDIRYVVIGKQERGRYPEMNPSNLRKLGRTVVVTAAGEVIAIVPERCES